VAISAEYTGVKTEKSMACCYVGELYKNNDELSEKYIEKIFLSLQKKYSAQKCAGVIDNDGLGEIISEINTLIGG
jgi:hypothetical protein